ncbi:hypothetical protein BV22DRAFT_981799, partial [Leucogyrophana mollusca]
MNTVNASTGFSPFQLHLGRSPRLIPPLLPSVPSSPPCVESDAARALISRLQIDVMDAHDSLLAAKTSQAFQANKKRCEDPPILVGDMVMLATKHRRRAYMQNGDGRVAK